MKRFRVYKAYDHDGRFASFVAKTATGSTRSTSDLKELVDYVKKGRCILHLDLVITFNTTNDIEWSAEDSFPRRHAPLSAAEQEEFFYLLAAQ